MSSPAGSCPMGHGKPAAAPPAAASLKGECPMSAGTAKPKVYDVYSREIDPANQMPANVAPSQLPLPGQAERVSTGRVQSTIPKGNTDSTWLYPSPQMFLNALSRKNKAGDVTEKDAEVIVAIHNNMNERTWDEVMRWEEPFLERCPRPALLRFRGRPDELSNGARLKSLFGGPRPFDRHDWIVDRCGKEVRYVIDYYHDESKDKGLDTPPAPSAADKSVTSITVNVRPASDSIANIWQRAKMAVRSWAPRFGTTSAAAAPAVAAPAAPVTFPNAVLGDDEFKFLSSLDLAKVNQLNARVREKCSPLAAAHAESLGEPDAVVQRAQMALTCCISSIVCPQATTQFLELLDKDGVDPSQSYQALEERVGRYWHQSKKVRELQAAPARAAAPPAKLQE